MSFEHKFDLAKAYARSFQSFFVFDKYSVNFWKFWRNRKFHEPKEIDLVMDKAVHCIT